MRKEFEGSIRLLHATFMISYWWTLSLSLTFVYLNQLSTKNETRGVPDWLRRLRQLPGGPGWRRVRPGSDGRPLPPGVLPLPRWVPNIIFRGKWMRPFHLWALKRCISMCFVSLMTWSRTRSRMKPAGHNLWPITIARWLVNRFMRGELHYSATITAQQKQRRSPELLAGDRY